MVGALFLPSLLLYWLAYELRGSTFTQAYFDYGWVHDYSYYVAFGAILTISTAFTLVVLPLAVNKAKASNDLDYGSMPPPTDFPFLRAAYYMMGLASILAFFINFHRVGYSISLLFISPREYEEQFGASTVINYIYFLNIPALCVSIYCQRFDQRPRFSKFLNTCLVLISFFHGIKFTVFDTILIPAIFHFHLSSSKRAALFRLAIFATILIAFYLAFSLYVRGAQGDENPLTLILNYALPNYYNFAYVISSQPIQFDPLSLFVPDKIPNPFRDISIVPTYGFLLNEKFNMPTAFGIYYSSIPIIGGIVILPVIFLARLRAIGGLRGQASLHSAIILTYIDYALLFTFYFYAFTKTKYVYYIAVMIILSWLSRINHRSSGAGS